MKKILIISFLFVQMLHAQTSGYVLMNADGTVSLPNNSINVSKVIGLSDSLAAKAAVSDVSNKQDLLVNQTNIKSINGNSLLGGGNIAIGSAMTYVPLAANFSSTSVTPAAVTGWSFSVTSGVAYRVTVIGDFQTAATTTGGILGISLTTATGTVRGYASGTVSNAAVATELKIPIRATSGAGSTLTTTGVSAQNSPHYIGLDIVFICTGTGTMNIVWGSEVAGSAAQLNQNSILIYQALN